MPSGEYSPVELPIRTLAANVLFGLFFLDYSAWACSHRREQLWDNWSGFYQLDAPPNWQSHTT